MASRDGQSGIHPMTASGLSSALVLVYRIDAAGNLTFVNDAWSKFARDNHGETVLPEQVLGRSLMASLAGATIRELYLRMIQRARAGVPVRFQYRCDAPAKRRVFEMNIRGLAGGAVEFTSALLQEETRPPVALLEANRPRDDRLLLMCSWCQQVAVAEGRWEPVETAVTTLGLMEAETLPDVTHGICPPCAKKMRASIGLE